MTLLNNDPLLLMHKVTNKVPFVYEDSVLAEEIQAWPIKERFRSLDSMKTVSLRDLFEDSTLIQ